MWEVIAAALALIASVAATLAAYVGIRRRVRAELEARYDAELRALRLAAYPKLWAATEALAMYAREPPGYPTKSALETMSKTFRQWYFNEGGLYLSAEARNAYFQFQDALAAVLTSPRWSERDIKQIDKPTFEALREIGSWLRTALTYDVGTRRRFSLAPGWVEEDKRANARAIADDREAKQRAQRLAQEIRRSWVATAD
jgi:hypothetical protein